jgi:glycosyltransferase involved in cell wall biosynthesis
MGNSPRVALFISGLDGGGAERVMINLGRGLVERGVAVDLVLVYPGGPYLAQVDARIRVVELGAKRLITAPPKLAGYLRREQPQALVSALEDNNVVALVAVALARTSTRCVVTVHNHLSVEARHATRFKQRFGPLTAALFYRFADAVVAVSKGATDDLLACGVPADRLRTIYNPIHTGDPAAAGDEPVSHPWFRKPGRPVVVGVGRLAWQKDFRTLLLAVARMRWSRPVNLLLIGEGPEQPKLKATAKALGIADLVAFSGFVPNPSAWMARADLLVLSSLYEGFGNVLVEAMAVGTPVVATDCPSGPAEILNHGRFGRLVPPKNSAALAAAMVATLDEPPDPGHLIGRAAEFSLDNAVDAYLPLLGLGTTARPCRTAVLGEAKSAPGQAKPAGGLRPGGAR